MEQALIDEIVAKVVGIVRVKMMAGLPKQRVLMLFSGASTGYVVGMDTIKLLTRAGHDLTVFMTESAVHVIGEDNVRMAGATEIIGPNQWVNTPGLVRETDLVLVPTLSMNTAARLALGLMDSLFSTLVLGALLDNKPVIAVCDGADPYGKGGLVFSDTYDGAPALRAQLTAHLGKLIEFGVDLVAEADFVAGVLHHMQAGRNSAPPGSTLPALHATVNGTSSVLTAADLDAYQPGTTLYIPADMRLTPLAKERAAKQSLRLVFEE